MGFKKAKEGELPKPRPKERPFTTKQLKFIEAYNGNGTEAARVAGYHGNDNVLGCVAYENLRKPRIRKAIQKRARHDIEPLIANAVEMQVFWSKTMSRPTSSMKDRLRASELLGKSQALFVEKVQHTGKDGNAISVVIALPPNGRETPEEDNG